MNDYVVDTHALLWYLIASPLLGQDAKIAFDEGKSGSAFLHIPAIVISELYYTNVKLGKTIDFTVDTEGWKKPDNLY